jgi:hypothetical protein
MKASGLGRLAGVLLLLQTAAAGAAPRDDMLSGIARCSSIADERSFLDCIYGAAQPVRAELGLPPASQEQTRLVPQAPASALPPAANRAQPGQSRDLLGEFLGAGKPVAPSLAMRSYVFNPDGFFTVTLSNGETWSQVRGDFYQAHWNKAAASYTVSVVTGAGGSFNLQVKGEAELYKV